MWNCTSCNVPFETLNEYMNHVQKLHNHDTKLIISCHICNATFKSLHSYQSHWTVAHGTADESSDDQSEDGNNNQDFDDENIPNFQVLNTNEIDDDDEVDPIVQPSDRAEHVAQQVLYMLLTLQVMHNVSEECVKYVANSLSEIFIAASDHSDLNFVASMTKKFTSSHIRTKKATEYYGYVAPITKSYEASFLYNLFTVKIAKKKEEKKIVKYVYVPFLKGLQQFLQLPEVQSDLERGQQQTGNIMQDVNDGDLCINHPQFKNPKFLKIELSSDDLNLTNPVSHRSHSIFFFYWTLLNLSREHRSKQTSKRLVAACPKWARKYDALCNTVEDFLSGIQTLSTTGLKDHILLVFKQCVLKTQRIVVNINGQDERYYGGLFMTLGDYPAQMALHGFKESTSANHCCFKCDILSECIEEDIHIDLEDITNKEYKRRCNELEFVQYDPYSYEKLSKKFGINNRSLFDRFNHFDVMVQVFYDPMHTLLEGVCQNHFNAFIENCVVNSRFSMQDLCSVINKFKWYNKNELTCKPNLNLALDGLRNQKINRKTTPDLLEKTIQYHNKEFRRLYPGKQF
ncbi:unnamed protein product [Didymodactylos carnosus]|uniref:C2H2-type domain-containing protein n=1 Tax=Didymodactylos carnosus TaxID=1234261 RepID=A0A815E3K3_9BILA|nr:unnamed protein product [Didymodactylos carnosus]CAF4145631.1 unnamed protein product [Didymodactylos carnosus]